MNAALPQRVSLVAKIAQRFTVDPDKLLPTLKQTAFRQRTGEVSDAQMMALLIVADQYGLNPFTREIFAFPDKQNGIVPVVGVDGWSRIINDHEQSDGFEFRESEDIVTLDDAKPCPKWMEVVIYRKDRAHPIVVREYLDEVYRPLGKYDDGNKMKPGPWQTHTKRFLRHKCLIQGARIAYGFGGIYDEDEATRIVERDITPETQPAQIRRPQQRQITNQPQEYVPDNVVDADVFFVNTDTGEITTPSTAAPQTAPAETPAPAEAAAPAQPATPRAEPQAAAATKPSAPPPQKPAAKRADYKRASEAQLRVLKSKLKAAGVTLGAKATTEASLCAHFGIETIDDLPMDKINAALNLASGKPEDAE